MADPDLHPGATSDRRDSRIVAPARGPGTPRWVKAFGVVALIVLVLIVIVLLVGGGQHGPGQHGLGGVAWPSA